MRVKNVGDRLSHVHELHGEGVDTNSVNIVESDRETYRFRDKPTAKIDTENASMSIELGGEDRGTDPKMRS